MLQEAGLTLSSGEYDKQEVFNLNCHQPLPLKRKRRDILDEFSFENEGLLYFLISFVWWKLLLLIALLRETPYVYSSDFT